MLVRVVCLLAPIVAAANTPAGFFVPEDDGFRSVAGAVRVSGRADDVRVDGHALVHELSRTGVTPRAGVASGIGRTWGEERSAWPLLQSIDYPDLYPGVSLRLTFERAALKADYHLAPGADPNQIRFRYPDARATLEGTDLILDFGTSTLRHRRPVAFQPSGVNVPCEWVVFPDGSAGFSTGAYDHSQALIIDPYITSSTTRIGGSRSDAVTAMAAVPGAMLVAGWTESQTLPPSALAARGSEDVQAFVMKVNNTTGAVEYATWLGGSGYDAATAIAADASGNAYVTGYTSSDGLATAGAAQTARAGETDAFLVRLTAQGAVSWATYTGGTGTDRGRAVALTCAGKVWIAGETDSVNFPVLNPVQAVFGGGASDAFAVRFSNGGVREYATWLGGSGADQANAIAADSLSNVYLAGFTESWNFPVANMLQSGWGGGQDAFVTKLATDGRSIVYSTFLGGSLGSAAQPESGNAIAVDASGSAIVAGSAASANFPIAGSLSAFRGGTDAFLVRVHPSGTSLLAGTLYGDSGSDAALALATTSDGSVYFAGSTSSDLFPDYGGWQSAGGALDGFVVRLGPASQLVMASRVGGGGNDAVTAIAVSGSALYVAGQTSSAALSPGSTSNAMPDGFLLRLDEIPVNIDLNSTPAGRTIQVSGTGCAAGSYVTPVRLAWTVGASCTLSVVALQTAGDTRWRFAKWTGGSTQTAWPVYVTAAAAAYTAEFTTEYKLTSSVAPSGAGTLAASPSSAEGFYPAGTTVQLTATAASGWQFSAWSGGGASVVMDAPKSVTATFGSSVYDAVIAAPGGRAWIAAGTGCNPGTYTGTVTLRWTHGSTCTISVAAVQGGGDTRWRFAGWTDGSTANPRTFAAATGSWTPAFRAEHKLTLSVSPSSGGSVAANPPSADGYYTADAAVQLTAAPATGYQFFSWSGTNSTTVVMNAPRSVIAYFAALAAPVPVSVTPVSGSGESQTFTALFSASGAAVEKAFWVAGDRSGAGSCLLEYTPATRQVRLMSDSGSTWSVAAAAGSAALLSNSQCSVALPSSGGQVTGARLELTLAVSFTPAFRGDRKIYLLATNETLSMNSGWMEAGSWKVTAGNPAVALLTPDIGTGASGTYTAEFRHSGGTSELYLGYILFLPTPNIIWYTARGSCLVEYNRISNGIRLINETGDGWLGPIEGVAIRPTAQPLANSRCQVNVAGSRASVTQTGMTVTVPVTFRSGFTGVLATFLQAQDVSGNWTGMTQFGNVTAYGQTSPKPGPYIATFSIPASTGQSASIRFTAGHTGGYSQLGMIHVLVSDRIVGGVPCQVVYFPYGNILNLVNDSGTDMVSPAGITPGSGTLSNSRCTVNGSQSAASPGGNMISLTLGMTFRSSTFAGKRNIYFNAFDLQGNLTHWIYGGTVNVQ